MTAKISEQNPSVFAVRADATKPLPFAQNTFGVCLVTDYVARGLFAHVHNLLVPGGVLIYETYGAHGENWRSLPRAGQIRAELVEGFEIFMYRETKAGPVSTKAVVVKLLARKTQNDSSIYSSGLHLP